ncbi:MAG: ChbG/HpnK family deacetylase [Methylophilaceae bacterium]
MTVLIISADDYAQSPAIDAGILALIQQQRLTATSCLSLSPRWTEAAKLITGDIRSKADIGLHLDFTQYEQPLRNALPKLIVRTIGRGLPRNAICESIKTQLNRFEDALGVAPDYIDGHQHVHQLPQIRDELLAILAQRYADKLPWIRIAQPPLQDGFKAMIIGMLGASRLRCGAIEAGLRHSGALLGVYGFSGDRTDYIQRLAAWLHHAQSNSGDVISALMCHPALAMPSSNSELDDPIYGARLREYKVFASDEFQALLVQYDIQLARGDALALRH